MRVDDWPFYGTVVVTKAVGDNGTVRKKKKESRDGMDSP